LNPADELAKGYFAGAIYGALPETNRLLPIRPTSIRRD
jgi:hypothetical protein